MALILRIKALSTTRGRLVLYDGGDQLYITVETESSSALVDNWPYEGRDGWLKARKLAAEAMDNLTAGESTNA